jgi:hypothetical protein
VPDPSPFETEIAIANLKRYKSPGSDQIPAELIQAGREILCYKIHKLIKYIWNIRRICLFTRRLIKLSVVIILCYHCYKVCLWICMGVKLGL